MRRSGWFRGDSLGACHTCSSLAPAQKLLNDAFGPQKWNERMLTLPTMPAATLQMDLEARPSTA